MKTKTIWFIIVIFSLCMTTEMLHAQSYDKLWKEVEAAEQKGLPKTALKYTEEIFRKAEIEKNSAQMLKAYTARSGYWQSISPDSFYVDLKGMEQWAATTNVPEDGAILHTLIALTYGNYANNNRWSLRQRTDVADLPSEEIREWSKNQFVQKVLEHTDAALKQPKLLIAQLTKEYIPFVVQEKSSRYYHHDLYHMLAYYNVNALKKVSDMDTDSLVTKAVARIYSNQFQMYRELDNKDALLLTSLDGLNWQRESKEMPLTTDNYLSALDRLIADYKAYPVVAEVYWVKANTLRNQNKKSEAYQICEEAIARYPQYERINALKMLQAEITSPVLSVTVGTSAYPDDSLSLNLSYANLEGFTVQFYKLRLNPDSPLLRGRIDDKFCKNYAVRVSSHHVPLLRTEDYLQRDTVSKIRVPREGLYVMQILPDDKRSKSEQYKILSVSKLKFLSRRLPDKHLEVVVLDGMNGHPVPDAQVRMYVNEKGNIGFSQAFTTNADGRVSFPWNEKYVYMTAEKGTDKSMSLQRVRSGYYGFAEEISNQSTVRLLTDRSIYRPGQTVYIKGIAYSQSTDTANVVVGEKFTLALTDPNGREIHKKEAITNGFGSFTAEFILPTGGLNGDYFIRTSNGSTHIRVEEYKRPTFEITFNRQEGTYQFGDLVDVKGAVKTYSGVPVQELPVEYTVTRHTYGWWGRYYFAGTLIDSGTAELNDAGEFALPVLLKPDENRKVNEGYCVYEVLATVTNQAGETQTSTVRIAAGSRSLLLSANIAERLNKDGDMAAIFNATNLNGQPVSIKGEYKLYRFIDRSGEDTEKDPAYTGTFTSNVVAGLSEWKSLSSGKYKLVLTAKDEQGREASSDTPIVLFSINDQRPAADVGIWYYGINTEFDALHPAEFIIGTSKEDTYIFMDVFSGKKRLESRTLHLSDSVMRFTYPYKEEYGDGLSITYVFVKNGVAVIQDVTLQKKRKDKELKLAWSTFRDKLRPGEQEEWKLTIKNPDGSFADAELLAMMYDASLDQIWKRNQDLMVYYQRFVPYTSWMTYQTDMNYYRFWFETEQMTYPGLNFDRFWMWEPYPYFNAGLTFTTGRIRGLNAKQSRSMDVLEVVSYEEMAVTPQATLNESMIAGQDQGEDGMASGGGLLSTPAELRTNFAETAFFYPQLRTNENGEVVIAFTMPESLTRWSFNGYAHTKGMYTGSINSEVVTSKEFMLTPNLPRFVRVGDKTAVAATVANLTEGMVSGNVVLTLFDPLTNKVVATQKQKFVAEAGKTVGVNFMFTATDKYSLLGCRLIAEGGSFSDGEQHLLPILSNKERVLETIPMPVRGNQIREFPLEKLFNNNSKTATDRSLTVEFSGNPAWYAVQALPSLSLPTHDNAISWATAYYANSLAAYIMNSQPRLKAVFEAWKQQGGTKETFLSNLQKNQDVKNILLEESPWIMEATTEQEQKERIAMLFDLNTIQNNNITALNKLRELQLANGSWTWYKGMEGSHYVTHYVTQILARLTELTRQPLDNDMVEMRKSAFAYLHKEAQREYDEIRKAEKNGGKFKGISSSALQYLYLVAISNEEVPGATKTAYTYFLNKVKETIATQSVTEKALAAVIMQKAGRPADAQFFIASLKEYTTQTDEHGMFFDFNENPYAWTGLKVPAHVSVMEAFDVAGTDKETVEEMKLWLLKEKQTQQWKSPVATVNAVYALLYCGSSLTENQGDVRITLGGKSMETLTPANSMVPGIAYIKETITDQSVLSKAKKVVVEKRDAGIAWGAVYAQYEEELDKVASYGEGLNVDKKLYIERVTGDKKELLPITSDTPLKVGDKVVSRMTIKVDRAMDFVQLKDQRAACFEPVNALSGYTWGAGTGYYVEVKDASTNFFFNSLKKGVYVLEHSYRVNRTGTYESGLAIIQSAYAPEYAARSASVKVLID